VTSLYPLLAEGVGTGYLARHKLINGGKTMETETEFTTIQEILDGAYEKFGGWSMSASQVIDWIATELEALEEAN